MPFDRETVKVLADGLAKLARDYGVTSEKLLTQFNAHRKQAGLSTIVLSRSTLDRAKNGHNTRKIDELADLWEYLTAHPRYGHIFTEPNNDNLYSILSPEAALAYALSRVFPERETNTYRLDEIRPQLPGRYIMYRPHWRSSLASLTIQSSMVEISDTAYGLEITEVQDFPPGTIHYYYQRDRGVLFPYGKYIYFLAWELGGRADNTTVKLGLIKTFMIGGGVAQSLYGVLFGSSNTRIYPVGKFFGRRTTDDVKSSVVEISKLDDPEAQEYLQERSL